MSFFLDHAPDLRLPIQDSERRGFRAAQVAAVHAIAAHFWRSTRPALVVMPTGSGKTAVLIAACFATRATRALVIVPGKLLRHQIAVNVQELNPLRSINAIDPPTPPRVCELKHRIASADDWESLRDFDLVVATPNAVSPAQAGVPAPPNDLFDAVFLDEAHHAPASSWQAVCAAFPNSRVTLFTATPEPPRVSRRLDYMSHATAA